MARIDLFKYVFLIIWVICWNCATTIKQPSVLSTNPESDWTTHHPKSDIYYFGVGYAKKTGNPGDDQATARARARADISSQIRVHVTSVEGVFDSSVVSNGKSSITSRYQGKVTSFTEAVLEGVEIEDTKDTLDDYWVKMKLSKKAYREKSNEQVDHAKLIASDAMLAAEKADPVNKIHELHTALEAIDGFKNKLLTYKIGSEEVILNTEILRRLRQVLDDIQVKPAVSELVVGALDSLPDTIGFYITYQNTPILNCPLTCTVSNNEIKFSPPTERQPGFYPLRVSELKASAGRINVTMSVDFPKILDDLKNRGLRIPSGSIVLSRYKPSIYPIEKDGYVESLINELLNSNTFSMATSADSADYTITCSLTINPNTSILQSLFVVNGTLKYSLKKLGYTQPEEKHITLNVKGMSEDIAVQGLKKELVKVAVKEISSKF